MRLTTKMRYGTRAMLDLAQHMHDGPVSVKEMAARQELSVKYMEHLLSALQNAGLVRSERGARGGYFLARSPDTITLRQLFETLEGRDSFVECADEPACCNRIDACVTREVWMQMYTACMGVLDALTVADLARKAQQRQTTAAGMYEI